MTKGIIDTVIGAIVLATAGLFLTYGYRASGATGGDSYQLEARFDEVSGLGLGSDVRMAGVKVGSVVAQSLDPQTFQAVIYFSVDNSIALPEDTAAAISSEGLLGGAYLKLIPGGGEALLVGGDVIAETQDAVDLVGLISRFVYGGNDN